MSSATIETDKSHVQRSTDRLPYHTPLTLTERHNINEPIAAVQMDITPDLARKHRRLEERIGGYGRLAIAFSGGVDSTLLLRIAHDTLGAGTLALFADSPVQPAEERQHALTMADTIGAELQQVDFDPLSIPEFATNNVTRCYHCKKNIFSAFLNLASAQGFSLLADGTNHDDLGLDRPGMQAVVELGIKSPLADAGLTKDDIRQLSRALGLATWNKPSASCLATRIETDMPITPDRLALIECAEGHLHQLGYLGCRVRLTERAFVIELAAGDITRFTGHGDFSQVRAFLGALSPKKVLLDLLERESILS